MGVHGSSPGHYGLGKSRTGTKPPGNQTGQPGQRGDQGESPGRARRRAATQGTVRLEAQQPCASPTDTAGSRQPCHAHSTRPHKEPRSSGPAAPRQRCPALCSCPALPASSSTATQLETQSGCPPPWMFLEMRSVTDSTDTMSTTPPAACPRYGCPGKRPEMRWPRCNKARLQHQRSAIWKP